MSRSPALVLDTHIWIWLASGDGELLASALKIIEQSAKSASLLIPAISVWEVAMLESRGKISLDKPVRQWIQDALTGPGLTLAPLTPEISVDSCALPGGFHKDPADQIIVATARVERATLVTRDSRILAYGKRGYVEVLPA